MEHISPGSENELPPLTQAELHGLYAALSRALVFRGEHRVAKGVFTPEDTPEALDFYIELPVDVVKEIFWPDDEAIILDAHRTFLSYMTPHTNDRAQINETESNVYLNIGGRLYGSDVSFSIGYLLTESECETPPYSGNVQYEYSRGGRLIYDEVIDAGGVIVGVSTHDKELGRDDAAKLKRLLGYLLK